MSAGGRFDQDMYPSLFRRIAATLIDVVAMFFAASFIIQARLIAEPESGRLWLALAFVLLYEPVLTAYACTLGQAVMRTRVRRVESLDRITLGKSYVRFFMKYIASVFGAASTRGAVRVWPRADHRAIHDEAADTVVVTASAVERS